jgi:hypothetical protein
MATVPPIKATPPEQEVKADANPIVQEKLPEPKPDTRPPEPRANGLQGNEKEPKSDATKGSEPAPRRSIAGQSMLILALVSLLSLTVGVLTCLMLMPTTKLYHQGYILRDRMIDPVLTEEPYWSSETKRRVAEHDRTIRQLQDGRKP